MIQGRKRPILLTVWSPIIPMRGSVKASIKRDTSISPDTTMVSIPKISV